MTVTEPEAETSETLAAQAQQLRTAAEEARAEQARVLAAAQAEADRLLAEAQRQGGALWKAAADADGAAQQIEERASYVRHAEQLREQVPAAAQVVTGLQGEAEQLAEQVAALDERLGELGAERQQTEAELTGAADAGNVDQAVTARTRLAALDDVTTALRRQRATATARLQAIGDGTGPGELARALARFQGLSAELRRIENILDPDRPEAVADKQFEYLQAVLTANIERMEREQADKDKRPTFVRN